MNTKNIMVSEDRLSYLETGIGWAVFSGVTVVGMVGNLFVIFAILGSPSMRSSLMNLLLANLAVADFANLLSCTFDWTQILLTRAPIWLLPDIMCPMIRYFDVVFLYTSLLFQVAVCIERYLATAHPLRVKELCGQSGRWIGAIWAVSLLSALPYLLLYRSLNLGCHPLAPFPIAFKTAEFLLFYLLPLATITALYSRISFLLWNTSVQLEGNIHDGQTVIGDALPISRVRGRRRVVVMLIICVSIYFICYSPIQVLFLSQAIFGHRLKMDFAVSLLLNALCYTNSACNPIVYTIFSSRFRLRFAQLACSALNRQRPSFPISSNHTAAGGRHPALPSSLLLQQRSSLALIPLQPIQRQKQLRMNSSPNC